MIGSGAGGGRASGSWAACSQAAQWGLWRRPAKGLGSLERLRGGATGWGGLGASAGRSLGHMPCRVVFQKWRWTGINVTLGLTFIASLRKEWPMTFIAVRCPHCQSDQIVKRGKTARGTQRYFCQNTLCAKGSFLLDYCNRGCLPEVKQMIIDMSLNTSGVRDTARSLHICPNTILRELKKKEVALDSVNTALLRTLNPVEVVWDMERAGEAEVDE